MSRPTPTTAAPVGYAIHLRHQGLAMDRNGQLLIFATHADAVRRLESVRGTADIMPIDLVRAR